MLALFYSGCGCLFGDDVKKPIPLNDELRQRVQIWMQGRRRQSKLAELSGVSQATISDWLNGRSQLSVRVFEKLSAAIGIRWTAEVIP